eukprot:7186397-Lingulodinium_polyedra.AAC.1
MATAAIRSGFPGVDHARRGREARAAQLTPAHCPCRLLSACDRGEADEHPEHPELDGNRGGMAFKRDEVNPTIPRDLDRGDVR